MSSQTVKAIPRRKTREEILELSAPLFARHGYDGVSMRDVAAAVGLTQAALYYHFSDKDQLYLDAVTCEFQEKEAALKAMLAGPEATTPEALAREGLAWLDDAPRRERLQARFTDLHHMLRQDTARKASYAIAQVLGA